MPALNNARRERFCQFVASGMSYVQAYKKAGYTGDTNAAPSNLAKAVRHRIDEILAEFAKEKEQENLIRERLREAKVENEVLDAKWLLLEYMRNLEMARKRGQTSAANQALKMIGELQGIIEKEDKAKNKGVPKVNAPSPGNSPKVPPVDIGSLDLGDEGDAEPDGPATAFVEGPEATPADGHDEPGQSPGGDRGLSDAPGE